MAGIKGMKHYSREVKLEAIQLYFEEGRTQKTIAEELQVRNAKRVKVWVAAYRREGTAAFNKRVGRPPKQEDEKAYIACLEMENALLKNYHTELREKRLARRDIGLSTSTREVTR